MPARLSDDVIAAILDDARTEATTQTIADKHFVSARVVRHYTSRAGLHAPAKPRLDQRKPRSRSLHVTPAATNPEWFDDADCRTIDPEMFYPNRDDYNHAQANAAVAVCRTCPVRVECLTHALTVGEPYGIWGGLTPTERQRLTARRAP